MIFKLFNEGGMTTFLNFSPDSNPGWRLPSMDELQSILLACGNNKNNFLLSEKMQWGKSEVINFLTNNRFIDDNGEQRISTYKLLKGEIEAQRNSVEIGQIAYIILIKE